MADQMNVVTKEKLLQAISNAEISISNSMYMIGYNSNNYFSQGQIGELQSMFSSINSQFQLMLYNIKTTIENSDEVVDRCILCKKTNGKISTK